MYRLVAEITCDYVARDLTKCSEQLLLPNTTTYLLTMYMDSHGWQNNFGNHRCPIHKIEGDKQ